jgi:hypothetical protein
LKTYKLFLEYLAEEESKQANAVIKTFGKPLDYINENLFFDIQKIESKLQ